MILVKNEEERQKKATQQHETLGVKHTILASLSSIWYDDDNVFI